MKIKEINVLPPSIFNLLAAGEVVENPASIVKEAVENALDAGATEIEIAIEDGGFTEIRITDNGTGCDESQIEKVFLPHATSKISSVNDLERILTLGFRGEALSSIASVSRVEFVSRTQTAELASKISLDAGKVLDKTKVSANCGTELVVRNLFYNVPARRKFLGTMRAEENNVTAVVQKLCLANPDVRFKYFADSEVVLSTSGEGLFSVIEIVYGKAVGGKLIALNVNRGELTLEGFISRTDFSKRNRSGQTVMVNGRIVDGDVIGKAANDAFSSFLMVGNFPFFVINLKIDEHAVDVNVHPRKAQVKFEDERGIYDFVKAAVSESIDKCFSSEFSEAVMELAGQDSVTGDIGFVRSDAVKGDVVGVKSAENVLSFLEKAGKFKLSNAQVEVIEKQHTKINPYYERKRKNEAVQTEIKPQLFDGKILGTFMDTYILAESQGSLFIVDQHAAHERLLFDELMRQIDSGDVVMQPMLEPVVLTLSPAEMNRALEIVPALKNMHIECEVFGRNTFRITAVPVVISVRGIDSIISNILSEVKGAAPSKLSDIVRDKIISESCKSAIKAGKHLTREQVGEFLAQFKGLKVPLCPHGRPVVAALTLAQIEKMFKR